MKIHIIRTKLFFKDKFISESIDSTAYKKIDDATKQVELLIQIDAELASEYPDYRREYEITKMMLI